MSASWVGRLQEKAKSQVVKERVQQELKNNRDGSEAQIRTLNGLKNEYGDSFSELVSQDPELLKRAGVNLQPQIELAKAWLADWQKWMDHHNQNLAWSQNSPANVSVEQITARISSGATAASGLEQRAKKLDEEIKKLV